MSPFNIQSAQTAEQNNQIDAWVDTYLRSGEWINLGLADGLQLAPRYWIGPVLLPLSKMNRVCGPESHMEYRQDPVGWEKRVSRIVTSFTSLDDMPPLIVSPNEHGLRIADGNHRYEALERLGITATWVFIWFDSLTERETFLSKSRR